MHFASLLLPIMALVLPSCVTQPPTWPPLCCFASQKSQPLTNRLHENSLAFTVVCDVKDGRAYYIQEDHTCSPNSAVQLGATDFTFGSDGSITQNRL
jgi:hypothetical protein